VAHQRRYPDLECSIAKEIGLASEQIGDLRFAVSIHDIEKVALPVEILSKPGRLSESVEDADFTKATLTGANLMNIKGVTIEQISKAKTLYRAKLNHDLGKLIREKFPHLLEKPKLKEAIE
jgi:response regulator RpfG family c-di-GMP phosphodiesterase